MSFPLTTGLIDTLRFGSYLIEARLTVFRKGKRITTLVFPVSTVKITMNRNSSYRTQGHITMELQPTVPPPVNAQGLNQIPLTPRSVTSPFGNEVYVETRITSLTQSTFSWIPLGLFSIATTTVDDTGTDLVQTFQVYTRAWVIGQRLLKKAYQVPSSGGGGTLAGELKNLLTMAWGTTTSPLTFSGITRLGANLKVPIQTFTQGTSPWTAAQQMALSVGYEIWITTATIVRTNTTTPPLSIHPIVMARPVPMGFLGWITLTTTTKVFEGSMGHAQPVWWFTTTKTLVYGSGTGQGSSALYGDQYTVPVGTQIQLNRTGVYNTVVLTGASTSTAPGATHIGPFTVTTVTTKTTGTAAVRTEPIIATAKTATSNSAMNVNTSAVGELPKFVTTSMIASAAGAQQAAISDLAQSLSDAWIVTVTTSPNPALRVNDVVSVTRPRLGLQTCTMIVDTITHTISFATLTTVTGRVIRNNTTQWKPPK